MRSSTSSERRIVRSIQPQAESERFAAIKQSELAQLCPELREIMELEIEAGNEVVETHAGWPNAASIFVSLRRPFLVKPHTLPSGVVFREVNDPHWWKAEYFHEPSAHILACRF